MSVLEHKADIQGAEQELSSPNVFSKKGATPFPDPVRYLLMAKIHEIILKMHNFAF